MYRPTSASIEYDTGPAFWAALTVFLLGLVVNFLLVRPGWLLPAAIVAGGVATARSTYYDPVGNSGAIGVLVGTLCLTPILAVSRTQTLFGIEGAGDTIFVTTVLTLGWVVVLVIVVAPLGYLGAIGVDMIRRRVDGRVGYQH